MTPSTQAPLPRMSGSHYVPKVSDTITVQLPDEATRAKIERVISDVAVIASLSTFTTARHSHSYRKGDLVPCRFETLGMGVPGWRAMSEREMDDAEAAHRAKQAPQAKAKKKGRR